MEILICVKMKKKHGKCQFSEGFQRRERSMRPKERGDFITFEILKEQILKY